MDKKEDRVLVMVLGNRILVVLWDVDEKVLEVLKVRREEGAGSAMVLILLCYFRVPSH